MDVHVRINGDLGDRLLGASDEVEGNIEGFSHGRFPEADERRAGPAPTASKRIGAVAEGGGVVRAGLRAARWR